MAFVSKVKTPHLLLFSEDKIENLQITNNIKNLKYLIKHKLYF